MTIHKVNNNGNTSYTVSVSVKSKVNRKVRKQKKRKNVQTYAKAKRLESILKEECLREVLKLDGEGLSWGQVIQKWLKEKQTDSFRPVQQDTLQDYMSILRGYTFELWEKPASRLTRSDIKKILVQQEVEGRSHSFRLKTKNTIGRVYQWGIDENLIKDTQLNPAYGIKLKKKQEYIQKVLTRDEIIKLLEIAKIQRNPWFPIWSMAVLTGCRTGELYALTWNDVDIENAKIHISKSYNRRTNELKSTKNGKWRTIPINSDLKHLLLSLKKEGKTHEVLPRIRQWRNGKQAKYLKAFCLEIGITPIRFHDLRACFATQLLQNRVPPTVVMKIAGWEDMDTMKRYVRVAGIDETGATDDLKFLSISDSSEKILSFRDRN